MKPYIVYKHTSPDGKVYIGITCQRVSKRWKSDGSGYKKQPYFWNAIQKYGWDNFKHEILYCGISKAEAEMHEIELIAAHNSTNRAYGYNRATGGVVNCGYHTISPMTGKHHSDETRAILSMKMQGKNIGTENPRAKQVKCVETGEVFGCIKAASDKYGIQICNISGACKGRLKSAGGYHWMYVEVTPT